jgi:hypothetical protein
MDRAESLIARILSDPDGCESNGLAYQLLKEYFHGSPIDSLRILLSSADDRLAGEGTWVASELPQWRPLLPDIPNLLAHRSKKVRFWAINCVLLWAGPSDGSEVARAIALVDDQEQAVRLQAVFFLSMSSRGKLEAALSHLRATDHESPYLGELEWLLGPGALNADHVTAELRGEDPRRRRFAVSAAYRLAKESLEPLRCASSSSDPEIALFARQSLERL